MWIFVAWSPVAEDSQSSIFPEETDTCLDRRLVAGRIWAEPGPQNDFLPSIHFPWKRKQLFCTALSYKAYLPFSRE